MGARVPAPSSACCSRWQTHVRACHARLRGGGVETPNGATAVMRQPISLWSSLFGLAFVGTFITNQLAAKDLIPCRSVLRYQVIDKEECPDTARGGNATVLRLVVSTVPARPQQDHGHQGDTGPPSQGEARAAAAAEEEQEAAAVFDIERNNRFLALPTQFDLAGGDHMLWYRLHDLGLVPYLNRALVMALHFHLAMSPHAAAAGASLPRLLKLLVPGARSAGGCAAWQRDGGESAESAGVANLEEGGDNSKDEERLPSIIEYGLCRGTLGSEVVRLQVTRRVNSVWTKSRERLLTFTQPSCRCGTRGRGRWLPGRRLRPSSTPRSAQARRLQVVERVVRVRGRAG